MEETTSEGTSKDPLLRSSSPVEEPSESSEQIDNDGNSNDEKKRDSLSLDDEDDEDELEDEDDPGIIVDEPEEATIVKSSIIPFESSDAVNPVDDGQQLLSGDILFNNLSSSSDSEEEVIKEERLRLFFDREFSRPDLEPRGPKTSWTIVTYANYERPTKEKTVPSKKQTLKAENARIAEYFGEDLDSDEETDLVEQVRRSFDQVNCSTDNFDKDSLKDNFNASENYTEKNDYSFQPLEQQEQEQINENSSQNLKPIVQQFEQKKQLISDTIYEDDEDEAGSGHSMKQQQPLVESVEEKPEKKKKASEMTTKVVIRHLPKHLRKEEFLEAFSAPLPPYNYLSYTTGVFLSRLWNRKSTGFCTINFVTQEDAIRFVTEYRLFILQDEKGDEYFAATEFAVNQRIPKGSHSNSPSGDAEPLYDLENDANYIQFKNVYESSTSGVIGTSVNADGSITVDIMVKEIEERSAQKNSLQMTPLLNFVFAQSNLQKEKRFAQAAKKSEKAQQRISAKKSSSSNKSAASILKKEDRNRKDDTGKNKKDGGGRNKKDDTSRNKKDDIVKIKRDDPTRIKKEDGSKNNKKENNVKTKEDGTTTTTRVRRRDRNRNRDRDRDRDKDRYDSTRSNNKDDGKNKKTTTTTKKEDNNKEDVPPSSISTKVPTTTATTNNEQPKSNDTQLGTDDKSNSQKKKIVKKIIKIKKVKSKTDEATESSSTHDVTTTDGKTASITKPISKPNSKPISKENRGPSESSSTSNARSSSSGNTHQNESERGSQSEQRNNNNASQAQNDSKGDRSKKARPDQAIYRPGAGSLKSRRPGGGSSSTTSSSTAKKSKD